MKYLFCAGMLVFNLAFATSKTEFEFEHYFEVSAQSLNGEFYETQIKICADAEAKICSSRRMAYTEVNSRNPINKSYLNMTELYELSYEKGFPLAQSYLKVETRNQYFPRSKYRWLTIGLAQLVKLKKGEKINVTLFSEDNGLQLSILKPFEQLKINLPSDSKHSNSPWDPMNGLRNAFELQYNGKTPFPR